MSNQFTILFCTDVSSNYLSIYVFHHGYSSINSKITHPIINDTNKINTIQSMSRKCHIDMIKGKRKYRNKNILIDINTKSDSH